MSNPKDAIGLTKPALRLVPPALQLHVAAAMADGAAKYGPYNWRKNAVRMTVYLEAAQRHLLALLDGEDLARDSQVHHAGHVSACMGIILDALETGSLIDDRATKGPAADIIERMTPKPLPPSPVYSSAKVSFVINGAELDGLLNWLDEPIPYALADDAPDTQPAGPDDFCGAV